MDIKTCLKIASSIKRKSVTDKSNMTPEDWSLLMITSAYLKQKLVIKAYQKREAHWNKMSDFLKSL